MTHKQGYRLSTGKEEKEWDKFRYTKKQKNVEWYSGKEIVGNL
jgi:hypothetical protein